MRGVKHALISLAKWNRGHRSLETQSDQISYQEKNILQVLFGIAVCFQGRKDRYQQRKEDTGEEKNNHIHYNKLSKQ
jgi:hypothetical protein